jgi:aryl-alcohol dehydrogenase-like predicted oxidoreductase
MGVFAIRVFAGGALLGNPPSAHTLKTPFFPLDLYERDRRRAAQLRDILGSRANLNAVALQFVLGHPAVTSTIIGFRAPGQLDDAHPDTCAGLPPETVASILRNIGGSLSRYPTA